MKIKMLRELKGISQTELAKQLGVVRSTICQYEKGNRQPDTETLIKLADFFGVSIDYLLGIEERTESTAAAPLGETLTASERDLLWAFRKLSPVLQDMAVKTVYTLAGEDYSGATLHKRA